LVNTILLIGTRLILAPGSTPRPSALVFGWMMAVLIWLYESTLERAFARVWNELAERKRSEQAVHDSQARLAGMIDSAMDAIISLDADQRIILFNLAAEQMFRCPADEAIGQPLDRFVPERLREMHKEHIRAFGQTNQTRRSMAVLGPLTCLRANGEEFPAEITISQTEIAGQKIYTAILRDVTERVRAEKLQKSIFEIARAAMTAQTLDELYAKIHAVLQNLLPAQHFYIALYDRENDMLTFAYFQDAFDVPSPPGKPGHGLTEYVLRNSKPFLATREITDELIRSGQVELIGADSIEWLGVPLIVHDQVIGVMTVQSYEETIHFSAQDLEVMMYVSTQVASTIERKQAEQSLQKSEEKYRLLFENMMNGFAIHKIVLNEIGKVVDYVFLEVNSAFEQMTGLKRENIIGKKVTEVLPGIEKDPADWIGKYGEVTLTGKENRFEQYAQPLGKWYSVLAFSPREGQFATIFEDITERKQAEGALNRRVDELTALYQTTLDIISSRDLPGLLNTIVARAVDLLDGTSGGLYLCDPEQKLARLVVSYKTPEDYTGIVLAYGEGAAGTVAATGEPLIIDDYRTWKGRARAYEDKQPFSAVISAPMLWQGQVTGVIHVLHDTEKHKFTGEDLKLLTSFANQAATAVENARLLEETLRRLERLSTLRQIDQVITSSLDLRVILNFLLGHIMQQLKVDAATVLLYQPELQSLEFIAGLGFRTRALQSTNLRLGQGFAGQAALEQRIVQVSDLSQMQTGFLRSPEFHNEGFVTYVGVPLIAKGKIIGVLEIYHRHPLNPDPEWMTFLETLAGQAAIAIDNIRLFEDLQSSNLQLLQAYDATIEGWAKALELRDMEVEGHSKQAVQITLELARKMGIQESQLRYIRWGVLLHDIGKMGVLDAILQKPGALTNAEWEIMRQHPVYAYKWLSPILYLKPALDIPYCHHEKWDGTGYPRGLKGEQIPLAARIFAVVDVWDALTSDRPYRKAWSQKKARDYILKNSGTHFDPQVVDTFLTDFTDLVKE